MVCLWRVDASFLSPCGAQCWKHCEHRVVVPLIREKWNYESQSQPDHCKQFMVKQFSYFPKHHHKPVWSSGSWSISLIVVSCKFTRGTRNKLLFFRLGLVSETLQAERDVTSLLRWQWRMILPPLSTLVMKIALLHCVSLWCVPTGIH